MSTLSVLPLDAASRPAWFRQLASRFVVHWPLKAVATMAFMTMFFWAYFAILRQPMLTPTTMPRLAVDAWIPFSTAAFPVYASLWVYVSLPPAFIDNLRPLWWFAVWMSGLCLFCLGIFWFLPTAVPAAGIDWSLYPELALIKQVDAAGNACPSLHVASSVFAALWLERIARSVGAPVALRWGNALFCVAILWSTMATRQHVALDVVAGIVVGLAFALPSVRHVSRIAPHVI
ncbi:MAG TPA: phosphatase PAP2 family protein [Aromatoleum sp.]|uniref:phosphatase PAP2 family protein n=1 Tax=Aromatoleum sp. TaxID=2307007 RepID=UPI002B468C4C|nr:phosphatase PAP2 family protein [Aromatoleum sp.]HJV26962.1 phosphatase PAP2 family protein [Aromatoleum sp.]